jgi:predicted acylesterase/phospholipase RssA
MLFGWLLWMSFRSGGWPKVLFVFVAVVAVSGLLGMIVGMTSLAKRRPWEVVAALMIFATLGWFFLTDSYKSLTAAAWDAASMILGAIIGQVAWKALVAMRRWLPRQLVAWVQTWPDDAATVGKLLAAWVGVTVVVLFRTQQLPADPGRFANIGAQTPELNKATEDWDGLRVGLALSGGGYRAAVMHAGTLRALESLGIRVDALSTVSGGSIIGAYYAVGGDPVVFKDAVAAGRFNLKRELVLIHNAARLPFPLTVPGIDVPLFPYYDFHRRDAQVGMLDRVLFDHRDTWRAPRTHQPLLAIATTDLTYGLTVGLLNDGLVTITASGDVEAYRGDAVVLSQDLSLAQRVAISGAFPIAFPPQPLGVRVIPLAATGTGMRPLMLVDGGVADNSGLDLLVAADSQACRPKDCPDNETTRRHFLGPEWALDVFLASDAGAIFGVQQDVRGMDALSRAFDVSTARINRSYDPAKRPLSFSAQSAHMDPGQQFRLYEDRRANDPSKLWHTSFDPRDLPAPLLDAIVALLPEESSTSAQANLQSFLQSAAKNTAVDQERWTHTLTSYDDADACRKELDELRALPGLCDAVALRLAIRDEAGVLLEAFRQTSTLDDQLPKARVDALYRLGHFLVYLNWRDLERTMEAALARRADTLE